MMIIQSMVLVSSLFLTLSMVTPTYQQLPQQLQGYRMEQAAQVQLVEVDIITTCLHLVRTCHG